MGVGVEAEAADDPRHERLAVVGDDPQVVARIVVQTVGQRELDVAHLIDSDAVEGGAELAARHDPQRLGTKRGDERALPAAGNELDPIPRSRRWRECAYVDAERRAERRPQTVVPTLELAVEVTGCVTLAPGVETASAELGHAPVDEAGKS